jgi:hypothetical protein
MVTTVISPSEVAVVLPAMLCSPTLYSDQAARATKGQVCPMQGMPSSCRGHAWKVFVSRLFFPSRLACSNFQPADYLYYPTLSTQGLVMCLVTMLMYCVTPGQPSRSDGAGVWISHELTWSRQSAVGDNDV